MADLQYAPLNADARPDLPQTSEGVSASIIGDIYGAAEACQRSFESCIEHPALEDLAAFFHSSYGEFNIWCFGIKATASGKSSLDYRLRNHVDAQEEICGLLLDLANSLRSCEQRAVCEYHLVASTYDSNLLRSDESKQRQIRDIKHIKSFNSLDERAVLVRIFRRSRSRRLEPEDHTKRCRCFYGGKHGLYHCNSWPTY